MLGFLQGFAYGLFLSCIPWFFIGMARPDLALASESPRRWKVALRYWFQLPFIAFLAWLTSLWGGFDPSLGGWLAGLSAVAVSLPVERRWRRWRQARAERHRAAERDLEAARRRAALDQAQREAGVLILDPARPPAAADDVVRALCDAKQRLLGVRRPEEAAQADRLYTRYTNVVDALRAKFDAAELTFERSRGTVAEVCRGAVDNLFTMASIANGIAAIDAEFVRRRLRSADRLPADEREALRQRLDLVADAERRLRELTARNEAVLTVLDQAAVAVSRIQTDRPQASLAADRALKDLNRFIDRVELYGRRDSA